MAEVVLTEDYESVALAWLYAKVDALRTALAQAGIDDEDVQRNVCEVFFFDLSVDLDGEVNKQGPRPRLTFEQDDALLLPEDDGFELHDYAVGVVEEVFDD
jgi:hypothetical protein